MRRGVLVVLAALGAGTLAATAGCRVHVVGPARHHRHLFWFYPSLHVYYSPSLRVWWHRDGGRWIRVRTLPRHIVVRSHDHVEVECDHQDPYRDYDAHVRRHRPGRSGSAPGHNKSTSPGRSGDAPGHNKGTSPGRSGDAPGHNKGGANPGKGKGHGGSNPGKGKGHGGGNPGGGRGKGKKK